jgi:hypothetical protein
MASQGSTSETYGVRLRYSKDQKSSNSFDICEITVHKAVPLQTPSTVKAYNLSAEMIKMTQNFALNRLIKNKIYIFL